MNTTRILVLMSSVLVGGHANAITDEEHMPAPWDFAFPLVGTNGIINPEILVGFNPLSVPTGGDPATLTDLMFSDPTTAVFTIPDQSDDQAFQFFTDGIRVILPFSFQIAQHSTQF